MNQLKVFDLFCGTGGFSKGFEQSENADYKVLFGIDILPVAVETFKKNHRSAFSIASDVRKIKPSSIQEQIKIKKGELDLIIGGPPCQGFSSIRPFRSSNDDDPRNNLFEDFASFVNFFRPKAFVIENVVGLATHKNGETIQMMEESFYKLGYECDWKILNTSHFGIPQRRERLIFLGVQKGGKISFPKPTHQSNGLTIGHRNKKRMITSEQLSLFDESLELKPPITVNDAISDLPKIESGEEATYYTNDSYNEYQKNRRKKTNKLTLHNSTKHTPKMLEIIKHSGKNIDSIPKNLITSGFSSCYSRLEPDKPSVTLTVNFVHPASNRCIHPYQNRALTPREGARLQSFDDDFIFCGSRTQIVKQIGNAVPPLLGKIIGETTKEMLI